MNKIALIVVATTLLTAVAFASAALADSSNVSTFQDFGFDGEKKTPKGFTAKKPNGQTQKHELQYLDSVRTARERGSGAKTPKGFTAPLGRYPIHF